MQKRLDVNHITAAMAAAGLNQKALADKVGVSREAVSQWLSNKSFPRPDKLLRLGQSLAVEFNKLVLVEDPNSPVVAFRRVKATKTKDHHFEKVQTMGRLLRYLVPYLPFDSLQVPPILKNPSCDYEYLQEVTRKVRADIRVEMDSPIDFSHLIRRFRELQTVVIPVLWGRKQRHENAIHIYLPDSQTTWVYLNLDVNAHDFKFWMAHELGHCLSPVLVGNEAEDFADAFAGALLFPHALAEQAYADIRKARSDTDRLQRIISLAEEAVISPYTVYCQIGAYAEHSGKPPFDLKAIHSWTTNFNKNYLDLSDALFDGNPEPDPSTYIQVAEDSFETPFFSALSQYLRETDKGLGIVQTMMDCPLMDARSLHAELT